MNCSTADICRLCHGLFLAESSKLARYSVEATILLSLKDVSHLYSLVRENASIGFWQVRKRGCLPQMHDTKVTNSVSYIRQLVHV